MVDSPQKMKILSVLLPVLGVGTNVLQLYPVYFYQTTMTYDINATSVNSQGVKPENYDVAKHF